MTAKTFSKEELDRRNSDSEIQVEIERDLAERKLAGMRLREIEEKERQALADNPAEYARREAARRRLCRDNFLPFVMRFNPDYIPGWVHKDICRR